jgi:hypothetical protein
MENEPYKYDALIKDAEKKWLDIGRLKWNKLLTEGFEKSNIIWKVNDIFQHIELLDNKSDFFRKKEFADDFNYILKNWSKISNPQVEEFKDIVKVYIKEEAAKQKASVILPENFTMEQNWWNFSVIWATNNSWDTLPITIWPWEE